MSYGRVWHTAGAALDPTMPRLPEAHPNTGGASPKPLRSPRRRPAHYDYGDPHLQQPFPAHHTQVLAHQLHSTTPPPAALAAAAHHAHRGLDGGDWPPPPPLLALPRTRSHSPTASRPHRPPQQQQQQPSDTPRITCGLCYDIITAPLQLGCGHAFCASCLAPACVTARRRTQQDASSSAVSLAPSFDGGGDGDAGGGAAVQCPVCDCKSKAPQGVDASISRALSYLPARVEGGGGTAVAAAAPSSSSTAAAATSSNTPSYCDWCERQRPEMYCEDCHTSLCPACTTAVHARRGMSLHNILPVTAAAAAAAATVSAAGGGVGGVATSSSERGYAACAVAGHGRSAVKYYCGACREAGCSHCVAETHRGHAGVVRIEEVVEGVLADVKASAKRATEAKHQLKETVAGNHHTRQQFNSTAVSFEHQVRHLFAGLRRDLDHQEDTLLEEFRALFTRGRQTLLDSTDELFRELDARNAALRQLSCDVRDLSGGAPAASPAAAVVGHLTERARKEAAAAAAAATDTSPEAASIGSLMVPRGSGFVFDVPTPPPIKVAPLFNLGLSLKKVPAVGAARRLAFRRAGSGAPEVDLGAAAAGETHLRSGKLGYSSIRASEVFGASGVYQWKVRVHTFNMMIGVVSAAETREDIHQGAGFLWYLDISGSAYGTLGTSTPNLESLPPLNTFAADAGGGGGDSAGPGESAHGVEVLLSYDGGAETLSAAIQGGDAAVIGTGVTPPVQAAFAFLAEGQRAAVLH